MALPLIVIALLAFVVAGLLPVWPHSRSWGYTPSLLAAAVLLLALVLLYSGLR